MTEQEVDARLLKAKLSKELNPISYDRIAYLVDWAIVLGAILIIVGSIVSSRLEGTVSNILGILVSYLVLIWLFMIVSTTVRRISRYKKATRS